LRPSDLSHSASEEYQLEPFGPCGVLEHDRVVRAAFANLHSLDPALEGDNSVEVLAKIGDSDYVWIIVAPSGGAGLGLGQCNDAAGATSDAPRMIFFAKNGNAIRMIVHFTSRALVEPKSNIKGRASERVVQTR